MHERWVLLQASALEGAEVEVRELTGTEALGELFSYRVELTLRDGVDAEERAEQLLEQTAALLFLEDGRELRRINGIVSEASCQRDIEHHLTHLRLTLVPRVWLLSQRFGADLFLDQSIPGVLASKLSAIGLKQGTDFVFMLHGDYAAREIVVQYEETDLAFVRRWCEHEGIVTFFEHRDGRDVIVFCDTIDAFQPIAEPVVANRGLRDESAAYDVRVALRRLPADAQVHDYNYRAPRLALDHTHSTKRSVAAGRWVEFGAHTKTPRETERLTAVRAELQAMQHRVIDGGTSQLSMCAGGTFVLRDEDGHDRSLLITRLQCSARSDTGEKNWDNRFEAIDGGVMFRPRRVTPWPRVSGLLNATVDGKIKGHYAELDEMGRYHVRFALDRSSRTDLTASHPVRMAQPHAGSYYGMHFPLRPGTEVLLGFVDGNPDRPVIVGTAPNPETSSPVVRSNQTQNVLRTGSNNEMVIEDEHGTERIRVHTPKHDTTFQLGAVELPEEGALLTTLASISAASRVSHNLATRRKTVLAEKSSTLIGDSAYLLAGLDSLVRSARQGVEEPGALSVGGISAALGRLAVPPSERADFADDEVASDEVLGDSGALWSDLGSSLHEAAEGAAMSAVRALSLSTDEVGAEAIGRSQGTPFGSPITPAFIAGAENTAALFSRDRTLVYGDQVAAVSSFDTSSVVGGKHAELKSPGRVEVAAGEEILITSADVLDVQAGVVRVVGGYYPEAVAPPLEESTSVGIMSRQDLHVLSIEDCILVCARKNLIATAHDGDVRITAGETVAITAAKITGEAQQISMKSGSHSISSGSVSISAKTVTIKADNIKLDGNVEITKNLEVWGDINGGPTTTVGGA